MLFKEPGGYIQINSISRVIPRGDEGCTILQQGREVPLEIDAPAEHVVILASPVVPAAPGFAILRKTAGPQGVVADPVVAWRIGPTKAHPVGLCDQEKNGDFTRSGGFVLKLPDGSVIAETEVVYDSVEAWIAGRPRAVQIGGS
jgi:hypothetical protein